VLQGGHAACILVERVEKATDNRPARSLCYRKWLMLIPKSFRPVVGPGALRHTPSRAGANDDNETSVPPGGNLEGPGVACGGQPHAEDMTHCRLGIPRAEKWPAITIQ